MATAVSKLTPKTPPPQENESAPEKKGGKGKKLIILLIVALLLASSGAAAWYFLGRAATPGSDMPADEKADKKSAPSGPPIFAMLDPFTVNLQPEYGDQYLQVAMTLQVADQAQVDRIKAHMPMIRSRMLILLSSKKPSELLTADGKKQLAADIIDAIKQPFTSNGSSIDVHDVFFTSFVIQ